jgi:hypothetical protein
LAKIGYTKICQWQNTGIARRASAIHSADERWGVPVFLFGIIAVLKLAPEVSSVSVSVKLLLPAL